jgi:hypothetical protein
MADARCRVFLLLGIRRPVPGVRAMHVQRLTVRSSEQPAVALDGEPETALPERSTRLRARCG